MNNILIFEALLNLSVKGSFLIIVILGFRLFFRNDFRAKWLYNIWILVIIRFFIPILPTPTKRLYSIYNFIIFKTYKFKGKDILLGNLGNELDSFKSVGSNFSNSDIINDTLSVNWIYYGSVIWLLGIIILLLYFTLIYFNMFRTLRYSYKSFDENLLEPLNNYKKMLSYNHTVNIYISPKISSPMTCGIRCRNIIIPENILLHINKDDLKYILLHELIHIKRRDVLFTHLALIICIINWFNPIVWFAFFRSKKDCELACDESVLGYLHKEEYKKYGFTLINMMKLISLNNSSNYILAKSLIFNSSEANERITKVAKYNKKRKSIVIFSISIAIFIGLVGLNDTYAAKKGYIYSNHYLPDYINMKEDLLIKALGIEATQKYQIQNEHSQYQILSYNVLGNNVQFWFDGTKDYSKRQVIEITTEQYKEIKQGMPKEKAKKISKNIFSDCINISSNDYLERQSFRDIDCVVTIIFDKKTDKVYSITLSSGAKE